MTKRTRSESICRWENINRWSDKIDEFDNDMNTPKNTAPSVPKTGGSATAPAN